jgi:nitrogen fixation-related uncharacterized protein
MQEDPKDPAAASWHFDKRVPIALILAIFVQTAGAIWWASSVNSYIDDAREAADVLGERVSSVERDNSITGNRMTRVEVLLENQAEILREIRDSVKAR